MRNRRDWKNVLRRLEPIVKCVSRRKATIRKHGYTMDLRGSATFIISANPDLRWYV